MTDQNFKTSFIPAKPIQPVSKGGGLGMSRGNFLNIITLVMFLISAVVWASFYFYEIYLEKQIAKQNNQLDEVKKTLVSELVNEAYKLNTRMESVKVLLYNHISPSEIFNLLEKSTLKTVQFNNFTFKVESDGTIKIEAAGAANSYESIVLQSEKYGKTGYLRNVLFSGLQPSQGGGVNFELTATVDRDLVLYRGRLSREENSTDSVESQDNISEGESFEFPNQSPVNN